MIRKIAIAVCILLVIAGAIGGTKFLQIKKLMTANWAQPPESVSTVSVQAEKWQDTLGAIGSVTAAQGVNVTTEIAGLVREIDFESGAVVKQGDLLVRLDVSLEVAQLRATQAQLELARLNVERTRTLRSENMVSQSDLDTAEATLKQNQANADAISATIEKKTIRAPFAGRLGIRQVNVGQYLDVGKPIVSLQSLAPIYADFSLTQQELAKLSTGMKVRLRTDAFPDRTFDGTLSAINPELDATTRSIGLQATFDNPDQLLRPGMFAKVEVLLPSEENVLTIPLTAVLSAPFGDSVYVVESAPASGKTPAETVVRQQFIRTGRSRGDFISVESGLKTGDRIVSAGVFKLRNKMPVAENNAITPKTSTSPKPSDS